MTKAARLLIPVFCVLFLAGPAMSANKQEGDNIKFSVHAWMEYTDNRDASSDEEDNVDFFLMPRLEAEFQLSSGRVNLELFYEPAYRYRTNPNNIQNESSLYHNLGVNYEHKMTRAVKVRANEKLNITDDPSVQKNGSTLRRDSSFLLINGEVGANYTFSRKANLDFKVNHMAKSYDDKERRQESDRNSIGASVTAWRQTSRTMGILAAVGVADFNYHEFEQVDRGFASIRGEVGAKKVFSSALMADARVGWSSLNYSDSELSSDTSPFLELTGRWSPVPTTRTLAGVWYMLKDSDVYPFSSQRYFALFLRVEHDINKKLSFGLTGAYRHGEYDEETITEDGAEYLEERNYEADGAEDTVLVDADVSYKLDSDITIKLVQQYENVDSTVGIEFARNATRLVLSKSF